MVKRLVHISDIWEDFHQWYAYLFLQVAQRSGLDRTWETPIIVLFCQKAFRERLPSQWTGLRQPAYLEFGIAERNVSIG